MWANLQDTIRANNLTVSNYYFFGNYTFVLEAEDDRHGVSFAVDSKTSDYTGTHKLLSCNTYTYHQGDTIHVRYQDDSEGVGTVTVTIEGNDLYVSGSVHNAQSDTVYVLELSGKANPYEVSTADLNRDFDTYTVDDSYLSSHHVLYVDAKADSLYLTLEFNLPDNAVSLPAGTYPVNASLENNTVTSGYYVGEDFIGSFAGYLSSADKVRYPLWFIVTGTVTVNENGVIVVDARNAEGRTIRCSLGKYPEGVEQVQSTPSGQDKGTKVLRNSVMYIEHNGKTYNAQGALIDSGF